MNQHFLQSTAWKKFQQSLGQKVFHNRGENWEYFAILEHGTGNSRLYCPFGPTATNEENLKLALKNLTDLGKKLGVTFLRVGPIKTDFSKTLSDEHWKKATYIHLQPEYTHIIDLQPSEGDIISNMTQPVRNCYRNYRKKGVTVRHSQNPEDIKYFLKLIHQVAKRTGMSPHPDSYFHKQADSLLPSGDASFWYATYDDKIIATTLFFDSKTTRIYAHAAAESAPEYRKLNAGTALLAEAIIDAKHRHMDQIDLYGIAPENAPKNHPWAGFTRFKRSFGGKDVYSGAAWELPLKPLQYWLYRIYQTIRK